MKRAVESFRKTLGNERKPRTVVTGCATASTSCRNVTTSKTAEAVLRWSHDQPFLDEQRIGLSRDTAGTRVEVQSQAPYEHYVLDIGVVVASQAGTASPSAPGQHPEWPVAVLARPPLRGHGTASPIAGHLG